MKRKVLVRGLAILCGLVIALFAAELAVRLRKPYTVGQAGMRLPLFSGDQEKVRSLFNLDPDLGYVPIFGTDLYDDNGFLHNAYSIDDKEGRQRVLFLGDSVTRRGKIIAALRELYGTEMYEYWNAGVTAYNTAQEALYYERFASKANPDHVVLTFHLNDFYRTPISFLDEQGQMQVISPHKNLSEVSAWLFAWSHLYRFYIGRTRDPWDLDEPTEDIRVALSRLKELTDRPGVRLSVIVMPNLAPIDKWHPLWQKRYDIAIAALEELQVPYWSLVESLKEAIADGVDPEETPGDTEHPSAAVSVYFGKDLKSRRLFEGP